MSAEPRPDDVPTVPERPVGQLLRGEVGDGPDDGAGPGPTSSGSGASGAEGSDAEASAPVAHSHRPDEGFEHARQIAAELTAARRRAAEEARRVAEDLAEQTRRAAGGIAADFAAEARQRAEEAAERAHDLATDARQRAEEAAERLYQRRRRVGTPPGFTYTGAARKTFWRWFFQAIGGFKVTGSAPYEAMVVVANHSSHADTPALIAAFPTPYKPMVVAAEDYWFTTRWRKAVVKLAIGAVPVRRKGGGGYDSLVEGAQQVLGQGSSLLVFPEGTRSKDGTLGTFRKGALRMAKEFDVPILPVAVVGTHDLLPKGGPFRPGPVEVRLGRAIQPEDLRDSMQPVVDQIQELLDMGPASYKPSPTWRAFHRALDGPVGKAGAVAWGFAEATISPVTAEMYLAVVGAANPPRVLSAARWLAVGSVAGALVNRGLVRRGVRLPTPLTPAPMHRVAHEHMARGAQGVWRQALDGIPVKVYAQAAGDLDVPAVPFALHTAGARAARAMAIGAAVAGAARVTQPMLRRGYEPYLGFLAASFAGGLALVVRRWARR